MLPVSPSGALWANLISAVFEACDLAAERHVADGCEVPLRGRQVALEGEANFERVPGAPWHGGGRGAPRAMGRGGGAVRGTLRRWEGVIRITPRGGIRHNAIP